MSHDLIRAINDAWSVIGPKLASDPDALAARRARRHRPILLRPPRAWCLAVRACDTRLTAARFAMIPDQPICWDRDQNCWRHFEHDVTLDAPGLRRLCRPVMLPAPGVDWRDAAEALGVHPCAIYAAARRGALIVRRIKGLGGKHGPPIPVVYHLITDLPRSHPIMSTTQVLLNLSDFVKGRLSDQHLNPPLCRIVPQSDPERFIYEEPS